MSMFYALTIQKQHSQHESGKGKKIPSEVTSLTVSPVRARHQRHYSKLKNQVTEIEDIYLNKDNHLEIKL